ncbi:hypothetical protein B0H16DRAFT_1715913 [Mycena metata]|uniref:Hemerythrin-like domain-containing protein n=1 Tax=Mycena metata TaxID=1033252 RepID=A0AAD7JQ05_9AGAR|nr:hypothetical protein B0H16DRAFT_1715913 [Mycena metata]
MPAPYLLLDMPPADFTNMFDYQTKNMAAVHNSFIQGINAMVAHAPKITPVKVQPFMIFSLAVVETIHHHHDMEETFLFPELKKKLGAGVLSQNVAQHKEFVPQLLELKEYLAAVKAGGAHDGQLLVQVVHSSGDTMMQPVFSTSYTRDRI